MMKKLLACGMILMVSLSMLAGCADKAAPSAGGDTGDAGEDHPMQYVTKDDLKADIEGGGSYIILDVRKTEDYDEQHITGAYGADVDAAKEGDADSGIANLSAALKDATGSESVGSDDKIVLVCYSGKAYAQTATNLLIDMGVSADNIYTLEGGNNGWKEGGDDYTALMQ